MSGLPRELDPWGETVPIESVLVGGRELRVGDRVLLKPTGRADIFDIALKDRVAIVDGIEQDFEDQVQLAVVIEDDPGRDLGELRQPGHRFFFKPGEVEPL